MRVCLGSLESESWDLLGTLGVLPSAQEETDEEDDGQGDEGGSAEEHPPSTTAGEDVEMNEGDADTSSRGVIVKRRSGGEGSGRRWFEEIIEGSELGRIRRRKGVHVDSESGAKVEWEVVEFENGDEDGASSDMGSAEPVSGVGKRKIGEVAEGDETAGLKLRGGGATVNRV